MIIGRDRRAVCPDYLVSSMYRINIVLAMPFWILLNIDDDEKFGRLGFHFCELFCSIYPSAHDNSVQIPIGNNTGSLPDLTSVHFPSPLHTPLDQEHDHSSSPYSSVCIPEVSVLVLTHTRENMKISLQIPIVWAIHK